MLIVLTGPSHSGKSALARALLDSFDDKAAFLSVDDVLERTLVRPRSHMWKEIPLAYELLEPQVATLLARGWTVVFESTFTFVPDDGEPAFHGDRLAALVARAAELCVASIVVQVLASRETLDGRARRSERLDPTIVRHTDVLHQNAALPAGSLRIISEQADPSELARQVLERLDAVRRGD